MSRLLSRPLPRVPAAVRPTALTTARARDALVLLGSLALALLGACSPDTLTAPRATVDAPHRLLVPTTYVAQVSAGEWHTCAVTGSGSVACWGANTVGQGTAPARLTGVTDVSAGDAHNCARTTGGTVTCWGGNYYGQTNVPASLTSVTQVSAGSGHTCALTTAGTVTCWGDNNVGQATPPANLTGVTQLSAGGDHTCAVVGTGGTVTCWGENGQGESTPPALLTGVTQVSAGHQHTCALLTAGTVTCWGYNESGQTSTPTGLSGITQVSAGYWHTCAVTTAGTVRCWGIDNYGQGSVPGALSGVTQVSAGGAHSCAVTTGGAITCWGNNGYGQSSPPPPTHVYPTATFTAPASATAGQAFTLALSGAQVPGSPSATTFTYAFDCGDGSGYGAFGATATATCATTASATPSTRAVRGTVKDQDGDTQEYTANVQIEGVQSISFTSAAPNPAYVGGSYTPAATASSALPVVIGLGANSVGVCTLAGGVVTFVGVGTCTVTADQGGTSTVLAAPQATQQITVSRRAQSITFSTTPPNPAYVNATYTVGAAASSGLVLALSSLTPATCSITGTVVSFIAAGGCTIAANQGGNATFAPATQQTQLFTIVKRPQTITVTTVLPPSAVVTSRFTLAATGGPSLNPVVFTSQTPATCSTTGTNGATLTLTAAGGCTVAATQIGTALYADAPPVMLTMTALTPSQATSQLRQAIAGSGISAAVAAGLTDKLDGASASLAAGQTGAACAQLGAFQNQVQAQRGKAIPAATADAWLAQAAQLRTALGC
ncbi:hypothetical protein tb265_29880 [Gemmatimonadetes bacterium T265]|nr:hypothetical protein tb265_29880 [Gemmatimonadetes bacterium T265]